MGPTGYRHIGKIGGQPARQAFRYVDDVHLWMTRLPGVKSNLLAIGGPTGVNRVRTPAIRQLHQVSSVLIAHPYLPSASALGGKGDVTPIGRGLWNILAAC